MWIGEVKTKFRRLLFIIIAGKICIFLGIFVDRNSREHQRTRNPYNFLVPLESFSRNQK